MLDTANKSHSLHYAMLVLILGIFTAPTESRAEPMPLSKLVGSLDDSLRLKAMETQIDYARHQLRQEQAREGMQISARLDIGHHRQIVTDSLTRNYDALQPHVGLIYPLLGGRAQQLEATKAAQTKMQLDSIDFADMRRQLLHQLRNQYTLYWQYSQAEMLAGEHLETLTANEPAARKLHEIGMWTDSEHLHYSNGLAVAQEDVQRFRAMQRISLSAMESILGRNVSVFQPKQPDLPQLCLSSANLTQSAQRHSSELRKLDAQREALAYSREIGAGSSVNANFHLGMSYVEEVANDRHGYAATAGVSISMPAGFQEADLANKDRLNAALVVNRTLVEQVKLDIQLNIAQAFENLKLAQNRLEVMKNQVQTAREALRETRMQFDRLPYPVFPELLQKMSREYQAALSEIEGQGQLLQRTSDLLLLAPDSCGRG